MHTDQCALDSYARRFSPACAGRAAAHATSSGGFLPSDRLAGELAKMRAAVEKGIQLDPLLAEAHDALGMVHSRDGQWEQKSFSPRDRARSQPLDVVL